MKLTLTQLAAILGEYVDLSAVTVQPDSVLGEDVPIDSQDMLRVLARIEGRFGIRFRPYELLQIRTVGDLLELVASKG